MNKLERLVLNKPTLTITFLVFMWIIFIIAYIHFGLF